MDKGSRTMLLVAIITALMLLPTALSVIGTDGSRGPVKNSDSEPNNTLVEATEIDQDLIDMPGSLSLTDTDDFYKVHIDVNLTSGETTRLSVGVAFQNQGAEPKASILDPWGFIIDHKTGADVVLGVTASEDLTGYFYIQLAAQQGSTNYMLTVICTNESFTAQDPNNSPYSAEVIKGDNPDVIMGSMVGEPTNVDLQDFYKVHLDANGVSDPGLLSLCLDVLEQGRYRLEVYDSFLTLLSETRELSEPTAGHDTVVSYLTEEPGDFYVRVWAANGTGTYELTAYVMQIPNEQDGTFALANDVEFTGPNLHLASVTDGIGHNSYTGISDDVDIWKVPVTVGQEIHATIDSLHYNIGTDLPLMRVKVYDDGGSEHVFNGSGETFDGFVDPKGGFDLFADTGGHIYIEVGLEGEGSGGGRYQVDLTIDRPPHVKGEHEAEVVMTDEKAVELVDLDDLFGDLENDILEFGWESLTYDNSTPWEGITVWIGNDNVVHVIPTPRYEGHGYLRLYAYERDYPLMSNFTYHITIDSCGCHKVKVFEPYNTTGWISDPVHLVHGAHESDTSIDLTDIFYDPFGEPLEYSITGEEVIPHYQTTTFPPPGEYLSSVTVMGGISIDLKPPDWGGKRVLDIKVLDSAKAQGIELETTVTIRALPFDDGTEETSRPVKLTIMLDHGTGTAPKWLPLDDLEMMEDEELEVDIEEYVVDPDPRDVGRLEYSVRSDGLNLTIMKVDRSVFKFVPRTDWCGYETFTLKVVDTFGWVSEWTVDIYVECVCDGPSVIVAIPSANSFIEIFEAETVPFTVMATDPDTENKMLVYDWYVNGYPDKADGGHTYLFEPGYGSSGTHLITVEVTNSETGMMSFVDWTVRVKHINLAPTGWIEVRQHSNRTHIEVVEDRGLNFIGNGIDPERSELNYTWDFGDGGTAQGRLANHAYTGPGKYVVTLIVSDGEFSHYSHIDITVKSESIIVAGPGGVIGVELGLWFALIVLIITAVGVGSTEPSKYRLYLFLTVLYSKIRKTKVLDHYLRGRIQGYITANPGAHYNMIKADLQINNGNLAYHLMVLEKQGYLKSVRDGIYKRFYPDTMVIVKPPTLQEKILVLLRTHPGLTQKDIAIKLDESPSTINDYIRRMASANLIRVQRIGVRNHCFVQVAQ